MEGSQGQTQAVGKETNAALSLGLDLPGHTGRSDLGLEHPEKQGPRQEHIGEPRRSKGHGKGDHRREPWIGASREHGEKPRRIGSSKEAGPSTGSSRAAMEKERRR